MAEALTGNAGTTQTLINKLVADAQSAPGLVANLEQLAPGVVQQIEAPAMTAAHGAYGTLMVSLIAILVAHFGLGWSSDFQALVAGGIVLGASAAVHFLSSVVFPSTFFKGIKL